MAATLLGALLALTACGTTVPLASTSEGPLVDGLSTAPSSTDGPAGTDAAGLPVTPGDPVRTGSATSGSSTGSVTPGATGSVPVAPAGPTVGRTPSKGPIVVGVITSGDAGAAFQAFGLDKNFGNQRAQAKVVADHINAQGGVLGRPIKLVYYDYNAGAGPSANAQAACAAFTEDNHVVAAIGVAGMDDVFHACAAKRGVLVLTDGDLKSSSFLRKHPTTVVISDIALDRKYRGMVLALKDNGFFTPGAKVGILSLDEPNDAEGITKGMKPALASIGIPSTTDIAVSTDTQQQTTQTSSAVLRFRSAGVTHILFGRGSAFLFAQTAQTQGYFPKMGVESRQSPALLMQGANSPQQLVNTVGVGYQPIQDVDGARDPGPVSSTQKLCTKWYDDAGQGWGSNRLAMGTALYLCDELLFLRDAFRKAAGPSPQAFLAGVAGLGTGYASPLTFATRFSAAQHDGATSYRMLRYTTDCSCFSYNGPVRPLR